MRVADRRDDDAAAQPAENETRAVHAASQCPHCAGTGWLSVATNAPELDGEARLAVECIVRRIEVVDNHVSERDAARLLGRSASTLKRRRLTDRPIPCLKYDGRTRYRLADLAAFKAARTVPEE
ncbi:hypothetical protein [Sphingomonas sp.]